MTSERWRLAAEGWLLGDNRTVKGANLIDEERMRIQRTAAGWRYYAAPQGQREAVFASSALGHHCVDFSNPKHDFPQRIGYRHTSENSLVAYIAGEQHGDEKTTVWRWRRVACDEVR